jgi:hypothetical protein
MLESPQKGVTMSRRPSTLAAALSLLLAACAPAGRGHGVAVADPPAAPGSPARGQAADSGAPARDGRTAPREPTPDDALCAPLLIEADYGFGTHVVMRRLPNAADLEDLRFVNGLRQLLVALPEWPATYADLKPLQQAILPEGAGLVVLLPGWPPTREALGAWNLVGGNIRLILVVDGPPTDRALILEMNRVRALERVIAQMEHPARTGFERLQRPLSFRVIRP